MKDKTNFLKLTTYLILIPTFIGSLGGLSAYIFREGIKSSNLMLLKVSTFLGLKPSFLYVLLIPVIFFITYKISENFQVNPKDTSIDEIGKKFC